MAEQVQIAGEQSAQNRGYRGVSYLTRVPTCVVSLNDLRRLYRELDDKTVEAVNKHIAGLQRPPHLSEEQATAAIAVMRHVGRLTVFLYGASGEQIVSASPDALRDEQLPEKLSTVIFDSAASLAHHQIPLLNRFKLTLDFTEPPGFHTYDPWQQPTPNRSILEVVAADRTWGTAVHESVLAFFKSRGRRREALHSQIAFSVLNWLVGIPGSLWCVYRVDGFFPGFFEQMHGALRGAVYVYLFLVAFLSFRMVVAGFRWIFPVVELEGARSKTTRRIFATALSSLLLALMYDVLKTLFWK